MQKGFKIILVSLILLIVIVLFFFWLKFFVLAKRFSEFVGDPKVWKAIFLANGQVYFGKIVKETKDVIVLREVYYLQAQPPKEGGQTEPQFTLYKLGNEIHGPTNEMRINKDHILFIETLKPDSQVIKNIELLK
jgi:hypothetical protein